MIIRAEKIDRMISKDIRTVEVIIETLCEAEIYYKKKFGTSAISSQVKKEISTFLHSRLEKKRQKARDELIGLFYNGDL